MATAAKSSTRPQMSSVLDRKIGDYERPKSLPVGEYITVVQAHEFGKSSKKQTDFVRFTLKPLEALESVDTDALAEIGGLGEKTIRATYYLTENAGYRLKEFLEHCGLEDLDMPVSQACAEATGCQIVATLVHGQSEDGTRQWTELSATAPTE